MLKYFFKHIKKIHYTFLGGFFLLQLLLVLLIVNESKLNDIDQQIKKNTYNNLKTRKAYIGLLKSQVIFKGFLLPDKNFDHEKYITSLREISYAFDSIKAYPTSPKFKKRLNNYDSLKVNEQKLNNIIDSFSVSKHISGLNENTFHVAPYNYKDILNSVEITSSKNIDSVEQKGLFSRLGKAITGKVDVQKERLNMIVTMKYGKKIVEGNIEEQLNNAFKNVNLYYLREFNKIVDVNKDLKSVLKWNNEVIMITEKLINAYDSTIADFQKHLENEYDDQKFKNKLIRYSIVLLFMFLMLAGVVYFTWYTYDREKKLKRENIIKQKFFSIISHDLINPFNALLGYTQLLQDEFDSFSDTDKKEFITIINNAAKRNYNLVSNLLKWAKTQQKKLTPVKITLNLKAIINESVEPYLLLAQNKKISLNTNIDSSISIETDKNILSTCIANIVNNAIKFTQQNGEITIFVKSNPDRVAIHIKDNGIGMTETQMKDLFLINSTHSTTGTAQEKGSGLGLIICKELITFIQGKIKVKSSLNKGTDISLIIPVK